MHTIAKAMLIAAIVVAIPCTSAAADGQSAPGTKGPLFVLNNWCDVDAGGGRLIEDSTTVANYQQFATSFLEQRGFKELTALFDQLNAPGCVFGDGRSRLRVIEDAIDVYFSKGRDDWSIKLELVEAAKKALPGKPLAAIIEASYWRNYAWHARGSGYASSVSQEGWKLFGERLARSRKVLSDSKDYAASTPLWYNSMLIVISALDAPQRDRDALFVEGATKFGWYLPLFNTRAQYLAPWWGGDWDSVDNLIRWSVKQTKSTIGSAMYARMYWTIGSYEGQVKNIFKDTKASWKDVKAGFEDLMKSYPKSKRNLNAYARFACDAEDRATYLKLRRQIAKDNSLIESAWASHRRPEICDAKFGFEG